MTIARRMPGDRIRAKDWAAVRAFEQSATLLGGVAGLDVAATAQGTSLSYRDPLRARWMYVVGITADGVLPQRVLTKEALRSNSPEAWFIDPSPSALEVMYPAPGMLRTTFEAFLVRTETEEGQLQPGPEDLACLYVGGALMPPPGVGAARLARPVMVLEDRIVAEEMRIEPSDITGTGFLPHPTDTFFDAYPWPGQALADYYNKTPGDGSRQGIVMRAEMFGGFWFLLMTGDRKYRPFPAAFCDACTPG